MPQIHHLDHAALILVDIQHDFLPGGALATQAGDQIIPIVNQLIDKFSCVVATQDWHPDNHQSFVDNHPDASVGDIIDLHGLKQILWPVHCVQGSRGAAFAPGLHITQAERIFTKGIDPEIDSYSGFYDNGHRRSTGLDKYLKAKGIKAVYIVGLATEYCVKYTALDAAKEGFDTYVIPEACSGVELDKGDIDKAKDEMQAQNIHLVSTQDLNLKNA